MAAQGITMKFTAPEFLAFARVVQTKSWCTLSQKMVYRFSVENGGLRVTPSTGDERLVSNSELVRFCEIFSKTNSLKTTDYRSLFNKSYLLPIASVFDPTLVDFALADEISDTSGLHEGAVRMISVNAYERSAEARRLCIQAHGTSCVVCGFSFAEAYKDVATGFIHVHHLSPIALRGGEHKVDPVADLRPICPNCHAVIHLRGGCMSIDELKSLLRANGYQGTSGN